MKLDPAERFALVDDILHTLDKPDPEIDQLWIEEAERRLATYRRGEVEGIPAEVRRDPRVREVYLGTGATHGYG